MLRSQEAAELTWSVRGLGLGSCEETRAHETQCPGLARPGAQGKDLSTSHTIAARPSCGHPRPGRKPLFQGPGSPRHVFPCQGDWLHVRKW